jgi:hypothetical protein
MIYLLPSYDIIKKQKVTLRIEAKNSRDAAKQIIARIKELKEKEHANTI